MKDLVKKISTVIKRKRMMITLKNSVNPLLHLDYQKKPIIELKLLEEARLMG